MSESKIIFVDIDGTICENRDTVRKILNRVDIDYENVYPYPERIEQINKLYDEGHTIVYWTARGCSSGKDYSELTKTQLNAWGCKFHDLKMNQKPHFDMYICDKSYNSEEFFLRKIKNLP